MENFDWTIINKKIAVKSDLKTMYDAWTKSAEIEKWFLSKAVYFDNDNNQIDKDSSIAKGNRYEWSWYLYDIVEHGSIKEANGKDFIQFTFAGDCIVDVKLTEFNDYVIVALTQKNIPTDDQSKENIRLGCESGWAFYFLNLKSIYEGGLDLRNKNSELKAMMNN